MQAEGVDAPLDFSGPPALLRREADVARQAAGIQDQLVRGGGEVGEPGWEEGRWRWGGGSGATRPAGVWAGRGAGSREGQGMG